jgi:hypothetical protein
LKVFLVYFYFEITGMSHDPEESSHGYYVIIFAARFKLQEYSYLPEIQAPGILLPPRDSSTGSIRRGPQNSEGNWWT